MFEVLCTEKIDWDEELPDPICFRFTALISDLGKFKLISINLDKLMLKVMLNRILKFLNQNNILYEYQFGFRKNHATTHALTEVIDYIYKSPDEGNYVFGIYIDLKSLRYCTTSDTSTKASVFWNTRNCIRLV